MTRERASPSAMALLLLLAALGGCTSRQLGTTGVRVDLTTDDPALRPWFYQLQWLDEQKAIFTRKVPEDGRLSDDPKASASAFIQFDPGNAGPRRVVARGLRDGMVISLGAARAQAVSGVWTAVLVVTSAPGKVADADADDIPDIVDNCPTTPDPCTPGDASAGQED